MGSRVHDLSIGAQVLGFSFVAAGLFGLFEHSRHPLPWIHWHTYRLQLLLRGNDRGQSRDNIEVYRSVHTGTAATKNPT